MRGKEPEPRYHLTTQLGAEAHARRRRLQDATGWSVSRLVAEALASYEANLQARKIEQVATE